MRKIRLVRLVVKVLSIIPKCFPVTYQGLPSQPIFVFGSGRNGSTLLNRILNQHATLFAPPEQYFLGPGIIKFHIYNQILTWRDMVKVMVGELDSSSGSHTWEMDTKNFQNRLFESKEQSLQYLMDEIYRTYLKQLKPKAIRWVDTTPLNIFYFKEIFKTFPQASYVFLIRDGRDVISSFVNGGEQNFGKFSDPVEAAKLWNQSIKAYNWLRKRAPVTLVRYEELVEQPRQVISMLCDQLGIQFDMKLFEYYKAPLQKGHQESHQENITQPIFNLSVGNWEHDLDPQIIQRVLPQIEKNLKRWNYL